MPLYEVVCITTPTATSQHLTSLFKKIAADCVKRGAVFRRIDNLGIRPLAYRIKAHNKFQHLGRYVRLWIQSAPRVIDDVEHRLRVDEEVVRYLTIKAKDIAPKQAPRHAVLESQKQAATKITQQAVIDYYAAQVLLRTNLITPAELHACGTHYDSTNKPTNSAISVFTTPEAIAAQARSDGKSVTPSLFATTHHLFNPDIFRETYQIAPPTEIVDTGDVEMGLDADAEGWRPEHTTDMDTEAVLKSAAGLLTDKDSQAGKKKGKSKK